MASRKRQKGGQTGGANVGASGRSRAKPRGKPQGKGPTSVKAAGKIRPTPRGTAAKATGAKATGAKATGVRVTTTGDDSASLAHPARPLRRHAGALPAEHVPLILETGADPGYELLDSGDAEKLERYGSLTVVRPEAQALWPRRRGETEWALADATFTGNTDEDGAGRWAFGREPLGETWPMNLMGVDFWGRLTSFRHVGVFPEQLAHWRYMAEQIRTRQGPVRVLNLFGYTGVATLIGAQAGAEVTHVDASKKAIGWARENQALAGLDRKPIRWICDDAMKFLLREERRGHHYDLILTDPPKFGRGPNGEVWQLFDHLPLMLDLCRALLTPRPIGLVLTAYSIRASFYSIHELMRETMRGAGGLVESGELVLREAEAGPQEARTLSTSLFSRWTPDG
ncbi:class I SAM-dependent rRNA methyltransferase [Pseudohoeflea coraliihabitans]|uniref:class I SAM-dependent rRNA methyltransferase n=1 Tax=Pseudohoeflea coraliihabitans TaxID=2860393 RepID=UPI003204CBCA